MVHILKANLWGGPLDIIDEVRRKLKGVSIEEAIPLAEIGEISYYLFEDGVLVVRGSIDRYIPYIKAAARVIPFEELPDFLSREVEEWLKDQK